MILAVLFGFFLQKASPDFKLNLALLAGIVASAWLAGMVPGSIEVLWSPYQKLVLRQSEPDKLEVGQYMVTVNNAGYQGILNLSDG